MRSNLLILACGVLWAGALPGLAAPCSYTLTPASASLPYTAGSNGFAVATGSSCAWTATTTNGWIHTSSAGTGNGSVGYTFDANPNLTPRSGAINVSNKVFTISQAGAPVALNTALDNDLVWVTSPTLSWYGTNTPSFDGVDAAVCGNTGVHDSESWLETTVIGPGKLTFWWKVVSDPADALQFYIDGEMQEEILGVVDWSHRLYSIGEGTHTIRWLYYKDDAFSAFPDKGWLDRVSYTTNDPISLQTALDTCGVPWTSGGNLNPTYWAGQSNVTHDGISAAQSGTLHSGQESWMQTEVSGVTNVSFWWKVSSQTNYDYLEFYTNGLLARRISGEVDWQSNYFKLPIATNSLTWRFVRTNFIINPVGQMAGWVDQVTFSRPDPTPPVIVYSFTNLLLAAASNCQATLPDLTGTNYFIAQDTCSSVTVTQLPAAGISLALGTNQVLLVAVDAAGNSISSTNKVIVADVTAPSLSLLGPNPLNLECSSAFQEPGLSATDNCGGPISLSTNGTVGMAIGSYSIIYVATDSSGNSATNTRTVNVVDTLPPTITLNGSDPLIIECHSSFVDPGATALDACAGSVSVQASGSINPNITGTNVITYLAHDGHGNTNQITRRIIVQDTTPPAIVFAVTNVFLNAGSNCQAMLPNLTVSNYSVAVDLCGSITLTQEPAAGATIPLGTNQVVVTARDGASNAVSWAIWVIVSDLELPVIVAPANISVLADAGQPYATGINLGSPVTSDNCSISALTNDAPAQFPLGTNIVTWTVTDGSGNQASRSQEVVVTPAPDLPHQITAIVPNGDGSIEVYFLGAPLVNYAVHISSNLVDWISVQTNAASVEGTWSYHDAATAGAAVRFYRAARQ